MSKFVIPKRFTKTNLSEETFKRINSFIGSPQNLIGASSIQLLNLRLFMEEGVKKFRIVNEYSQKFDYQIVNYIRAFFRTFSDGIVTLESHLAKQPEQDFEFEYARLKLERELFFSITSRSDKRKPIGILANDLNLNFIKKHKLFHNDGFYNYLMVRPEKFEKAEKVATSKGINLSSLKNVEISQLEHYSLKSALESFTDKSGSKLTFIEGIGDQCLNYLPRSDPNDVPCDILVVAFVKDGEYGRHELSRPFDIWNAMEKNFVKLYQSNNLMGSDGSTWFFVLFKKRMLIQKNRETVNLGGNQSPLFGEREFKNSF